VLLQWKLISRTILGEETDLRSAATVMVLREGTTTEDIREGTGGNAPLSLEAGNISLRVISKVDPSCESRIDVVVVKDAPPAPPSGGTSPGLDRTQGVAERPSP
jgi:hypothetical protein